jgi:hypothetical protein
MAIAGSVGKRSDQPARLIEGQRVMGWLVSRVGRQGRIDVAPVAVSDLVDRGFHECRYRVGVVLAGMYPVLIAREVSSTIGCSVVHGVSPVAPADWSPAALGRGRPQRCWRSLRMRRVRGAGRRGHRGG